MTFTDRLAEMAAEPPATDDQNAFLNAVMRQNARLLASNGEIAAEIERLRARIAELEAIVTIGHGTMGTLEPDEPTIITHDIPPNAPR